jgi:hypothetical protein
MFSRLTQGLRWRWARALAAMYLFCVLAPGAAYAFGDGVAARCALAGLHQAAMSQSPDHGMHAHHHGDVASTYSAHDHGAMHAKADSSAFAPYVHASDPPSHHSDKADKMCCGLACLSALPAVFAAVSPPEFAAAAELPLLVQALAALTPARLYKPPIV